jgi:hypothetical protein
MTDAQVYRRAQRTYLAVLAMAAVLFAASLFGVYQLAVRKLVDPEGCALIALVPWGLFLWLTPRVAARIADRVLRRAGLRP